MMRLAKPAQSSRLPMDRRKGRFSVLLSGKQALPILTLLGNVGTFICPFHLTFAWEVDGKNGSRWLRTTDSLQVKGKLCQRAREPQQDTIYY